MDLDEVVYAHQPLRAFRSGYGGPFATGCMSSFYPCRVAQGNFTPTLSQIRT